MTINRLKNPSSSTTKQIFSQPQKSEKVSDETAKQFGGFGRINSEQRSLDELNTIINEAKGISDEYGILLQNDEIDVKQMFRVMLKMNKSILEMMSQFKSAIESTNKCITAKFTDQLKSCTSFISNEINHVKKEMDVMKKDDAIESIKTVQSCSHDLKRVWIRFAYAKDAEDIRNANSHAAIKEIFTQLNIKLNMTQYPVERFFFQNKKFSRDQLVPEIALCCVFISPKLASIVKSGIRKFNNALDEKNKSHLIRYRIQTDWSFNIRKILKPCNEMKRFNIIKRVLVTNDGIKVYHQDVKYDENHPDRKSSTTFVNSMNELNMMRKKLKDFNFTVPATETYNDEYFNNSLDERKFIRNNYLEYCGDEAEEYEITDDELTSM